MTITHQEILNAFDYRHATKRFDTTKPISEEDFNLILEAARLSPSSLGLEPWKFLVIQNEDLRAQLKEVSSGAQGQLETAPYFVLILARKNVTPTSEYAQHLMKNVKQLPEPVIEQMVQFYTGFQRDDLKLFENDRALTDWAGKQTYIALANMMTTAALIGIDSCPMEGFNPEKVSAILEAQGLIDVENFVPSVMVAFGHRETEPQRAKSRQVSEDVIQWIK